jgi:hypothetical protein
MEPLEPLERFQPNPALNVELLNLEPPKAWNHWNVFRLSPTLLALQHQLESVQKVGLCFGESHPAK